MGHRSTWSFRDPRATEWVGEHRPELLDLTPVFGGLVELQPAAEVPLEAWRAVLPPEVHLVARLGPRTVHVHQKGVGAEHFVLKLSLPRDGSSLRRIAERARRSRAQRAYLWAHRLRALGIETPRPLGFLERAHAPAAHASFSVTEYIFAPSLIELRDGRLLAGMAPGNLGDKRALLRRVADLFARLHARGLFHGDLHAGNLLVQEGALMVIDLESFRTVRLPRRALTKNLVRLNRDFLDTRQLSTTDRMRFLDAYLKHQPGRRTLRRDLFLRLSEATQAKLRDRGEAFQ